MAHTCVVFDLDGTLLDTLEDIAYGVNGALAANDLPTRSLAEVSSFIGSGVANLLAKAAPPETAPEVVASCHMAFKEIYEKHIDVHSQPYAGIADMIAELQAAGIKIAVLSNKYDAAVKVLCEAFFPEQFLATYGVCPEIVAKPSPEGLARVMAELGVTPDETIYVGDAAIDVETARAAGVQAIGVAWGFRGRDALEQAGADWVVDTPKEIVTIVTKA